MASIMKRFSARAFTVRPVFTARPAAPVFLRSYASDTGPATPGQSGNVRNSPSPNAESQEINMKRSTDGQPKEQGGSLQNPVSDPGASGLGKQEEQQPSQETLRQDPNKPADEKAEKVQREGMKPLDPADK